VKVVILAGGQGTRLAEETDVRPKPMVEIGDRPIIWHIMKHYGRYQFSEFIVALGYKGEDVKQFFLDYTNLDGDLSVSLSDGKVARHGGDREPWTLHLIDTGRDTQTGGRVGRLAPWLQGDTFMLTYGDGVSNVDLAKLLAFHRAHGKLATLTAVRPASRFGGLDFRPGAPARFIEKKPQIREGWINGGFMVLETGVLDLIEGDETNLEADVLEPLSQRGQLMAYPHEGFWQCMDTLRDVRYLQSLWNSGEPPWVTW
jgi:glucose-1-phosphate cytidylyltransferase